eukprot:g7299.t1
MANTGPPTLGHARATQSVRATPQSTYTPPTEQLFGNGNRRPFLSPGLFATSPMICLVQRTDTGRRCTPLKLKTSTFKVECHIATVFCEYQMTVDGSSLPGGDGVVFLPKHHDATITSVRVKNLNRDSIYTTTLIPKEDAARYSAKMRGERRTGDLDPNADPELFVLSFGVMIPGDSYELEIHWFQPMTFEDGNYTCTLPMEYPESMLDPQIQLNDVLSLNCSITTGNEKDVEFKISSHPTKTTTSELGKVALIGDIEQSWNNEDFVVSYKVWSESIVASMNIQPTGQNGTFALSISPPSPSIATVFCRSVVYVIDRSRSMTGHPIEYARNALLTGLDSLRPNDQFNIIAYDHDQIAWSGEWLADATQKNIESAKEWVEATVVAKGGTDIMTPLKQARNVLASARGIPFVFLLTDGAVMNEREIARDLKEAVQFPNRSTRSTPRVSTFAIGPYCNHYFLKQLAVIGRGQFDVAFRPFDIQKKMERMLQAASMPVLTDVTVTLPNMNKVEFYPYPIPDLFVGSPILVSGEYKDKFAPFSTLKGRLSSGDNYVKELRTTEAIHIPLEKVFAKQRLDLMTARAWLEENDPRRVQEIVDYSMKTSVPSQYTSMVGIETTQAKYNKMKSDKKAGKKLTPSSYARGGIAAVTVVAGVGLAIGFGNVQATLSNTPVVQALDGVMEEAVEGIGEAAEGLFEICGECCGEMIDCASDLFDCVGGCFGL